MGGNMRLDTRTLAKALANTKPVFHGPSEYEQGREKQWLEDVLALADALVKLDPGFHRWEFLSLCSYPKDSKQA